MVSEAIGTLVQSVQIVGVTGLTLAFFALASGRAITQNNRAWMALISCFGFMFGLLFPSLGAQAICLTIGTVAMTTLLLPLITSQSIGNLALLVFVIIVVDISLDVALEQNERIEDLREMGQYGGVLLEGFTFTSGTGVTTGQGETRYNPDSITNTYGATDGIDTKPEEESIQLDSVDAAINLGRFLSSAVSLLMPLGSLMGWQSALKLNHGFFAWVLWLYLMGLRIWVLVNILKLTLTSARTGN